MSNIRHYQYIDGKFYRRGTLAQWLDSRNVAVDEPRVAHLPNSINPLQFLLSSVMAPNTCVIYIDQKTSNTRGSDYRFLTWLSLTMPKNQTALIYLAASPIDYILQTQPTIAVNTFLCTRTEETLVVNYSTSISASYLSEHCNG